MKTVIEMAREAAGDDWGLFQEYMPEIHRLVELVRADERARMAEQPAQKCSYPYCGCSSKAWCKVERNEALDKMAENARELGLDYEPMLKDNSNYRLDPPVAEPVVFYRCNGCGHAYEQVHPTSCDCMESGGFDRVEYYTTPTAAQRQWVGLTEQERNAIDDYCEMIVGKPVFEAIEAKLKNKNAAAQPAPVQDSTCSEALRAQGKAYPRTCKKCGKGPCIGAPKQPPAQPAPVQPMAHIVGEIGHTGKVWKPVQPAPVQEPVAWRWVNPKGWLTYGEAPHDTFKSTPLYTAPPAEPVIPDAMTSADIQEHIEYVAGWNDCRAAMLEMMK